MQDLIKTLSYNQAEIIQNILKLYVPNGIIDCDATYGNGAFYRNTGIAQPASCFDICPKEKDVVKADCRSLPVEDNAFGCMMFDPPFLATTGKSLTEQRGNIINRRFGTYPSEKALHQFYIDSLREAHRVLKTKGILIFKCQDKVSSGKQYMSHTFIMDEAVKVGFYPIDLFILGAKARLVANWQRNQKHARKYHCYFWVFQKDGRRIEYI